MKTRQQSFEKPSIPMMPLLRLHVELNHLEDEATPEMFHASGNIRKVQASLSVPIRSNMFNL
jgi:hypothetical protein